MPFKIIGLILLFAFSVYSGQYAAHLRAARLKQTEGLRSLVAHIRARVEYFNSPLEEIYASFQNKALSSCGFLTKLSEIGFEGALVCPGLRLKSGEMSLMREFAAGLGKSGRDKQLADCDYALSKLDKICASQAAELPKAARISKSFGFMTGIMLVILFI